MTRGNKEPQQRVGLQHRKATDNPAHQSDCPTDRAQWLQTFFARLVRGCKFDGGAPRSLSGEDDLTMVSDHEAPASLGTHEII